MLIAENCYKQTNRELHIRATGRHGKIQMRIHYTNKTNKTLKTKGMTTQNVLVHYRYKQIFPQINFSIVKRQTSVVKG